MTSEACISDDRQSRQGWERNLVELFLLLKRAFIHNCFLSLAEVSGVRGLVTSPLWSSQQRVTWLWVPNGILIKIHFEA